MSEAIVIFLNAGNGTLTLANQITVAGTNIQVTDLNNDSKPDIILLGVVNQPSVRVFTNLGGGQFSAPAAYPIARDAGSAVALDLDNDGDQDLIVSSFSFTALLVNKGDGTFDPYQTLFSDGNVGSLGIIDVNDDGFPDLAGIKIIQEETYKYQLMVYQNTGDGHFNASVTYPLGNFFPDACHSGF